MQLAISYRFVYRREVQERKIQDEKEILLYREQSEHPLPLRLQGESGNADTDEPES
jgi:hypothetical protein